MPERICQQERSSCHGSAEEKILSIMLCTGSLSCHPRPPSVIPSVARNLPFSCRHPRDLIAPLPGACGRGCAAVPKSSWGRGLFERSEFRSPHSRDWGKGTRRVTPGRQWFWVLLPKQKDLGVRGRNPARISLSCHPRRLSPTFVIGDLIEDPASLSLTLAAARS